MEKKKKKKSHFPIRLNLLFFSVFLLFSILILRLGFVQIVYGENFKRELERKEDITINNPVPRGKMFDSNYRVIVDNVPKRAITYTNMGASQKEMLDTADKLAKLIVKNYDKMTQREKKDLWIHENQEKADAKITKKELDLFKAKKLKDNDLYKFKIERITKEEISTLTPEELEVWAIYLEFSSGYKFTRQIVKNEDVTPEEFAIVSENLQSLPGVDTTTDWDRSYAFDQTIKSILGNVTKTEEGLPADRLDHFLSLGYNRNDRVGKSQLELQYEDVLHGHKSKVKTITDKQGNVIETQVVSDGKRGKDLVLTVDMDLQIAVEKIIEEELWGLKNSQNTALLDRAYVVLMDPNNGAVLTMAGKRIVKNPETGQLEMLDDALGTITTTYNVGSAVKGATVLTGFKTGVIKPGTRINDTGIKIKDTPLKKSYSYLGTLNDVDALKLSSNVYMFHTAIRIGKGNYQFEQPLSLAPNTVEIIRNSFASFGLGSRTGIDLPNESSGLKGPSRLPGHIMDLVIGQYDTYSPMQLAQYISTIANGGKRMKPHIVKEIREPIDNNTDEIGPVFQEIKPTVLNTIDAEPAWMDRVQLGFKKVFQEPGGTAYKRFTGVPYSPAGKTGTAEAFYDGPLRANFGKEPPPVMNLSLVTYAPSTNPEVAMAVIVPWAYQGTTDNGANFLIGRRVMDTYFSMKNN
ncbi:peptidoglycan D,D-transpeptidase FtsI family protein [Bacillus sp. 7884-1]|uniref:peptidoglycan D,D-transpeptidase FtsI family protein n=1 Tax=Bacillus sp. 7884-1 TaxID=2021693 RepID=UPI000BA6B2DB|nr:penicillin-binding protein 2 [Bacillus sp. 7884-1]PAE42389.1 penicillin-binding protein [Bacillus sp. 7884-1]